MLLLKPNEINDLSALLINASFTGQAGVTTLLVGLPPGTIAPIVDSNMLEMLNYFSAHPAQYDGRFVLEIVLENAVRQLELKGMTL